MRRWMAFVGAVGIIVAVAVAVFAVGRDSGSTSGPDPVAGQWPHWPGRVTCGSVAFKPIAVFSQPADAAEGDRPPEVAFRKFLEEGGMMSGEAKPLHGWRLLGESTDHAEFGNGRLSSRSIATWTLSLSNGGWKPVTFSSGCQPRVLRHGRPAITWTLARGQHLNASTQSMKVDLGAGECAGGRSQDERLERPQFRVENGALLLALWVRPVVPDRNYTCVGTIEPPVTIRLPERLGGRELLDGGVFPPMSSAEQVRRDERA
jgi:hypothetical protein